MNKKAAKGDGAFSVVSWTGIYWLTFIIFGQMILVALSFNDNTPVLSWANKVLNCPTGQISFRFHSREICREDLLDDGTETDGCMTYEDAIDAADNADDTELEDFFKDAQKEFGAGFAIAIAAYVLCALQLTMVYGVAYMIEKGRLDASAHNLWLTKTVLGVTEIVVMILAVLSGFTAGDSLADEAPFNGVCTSAVVFPGFAVCAGCIAGALGTAAVPLIFDLYWMQTVDADAASVRRPSITDQRTPASSGAQTA